MRSSILRFARREPVLLVAALAAAVSCCFVPPDRAYLDYVDFRTLALLYALMLVVAGLRDAGAFTCLAHEVCSRSGGARSMGTLLVALSFFSSIALVELPGRCSRRPRVWAPWGLLWPPDRCQCLAWPPLQILSK